MSVESTLPEIIGGRYRLERSIARGGMAEVWLATDTFLTREVAVKFLKPHMANDPVTAERFRREAVACAGLDHPNIVAVYDCFEHLGQQAVVMQFVDGKSLRDLLDARKRLGPRLTIHIGASIAAGLDAAHRANYVHRDVKPGNILVTPDGRCLLTDFGIAKALSASGDDLTNDNIMMGTAKYLSPELVRGKPLDGRADLYGLGLVLYECLAGRVPFIGETDADTALARLQREPTDLGRLRPSLSPQLVKVIHKLLSRNPADRYATGAATRAALLSAGSGQHDQTTSLTPPSGIDATGIIATGIIALDNIEHISTTPVGGRRRPIVGEPISVRTAPPNMVRKNSADRQQNHVSRQRNSSRGHGNRRLLVVIGVVVALCAGVLWQVSSTNRNDGGTSQPTIAPVVVEPVTFTMISTFDPNSKDGHENEAQVGALIDGIPSTKWTTTCYANKNFGAKDFVGVVMQLSRPAIGTLGFGIVNAPWRIEVYAAQDVAPAQLAQWGEPVTQSLSMVRQRGEFVITSPANYLLVVLREVGKSNGCSAANPFQGVVSGVTFTEG